MKRFYVLGIIVMSFLAFITFRDLHIDAEIMYLKSMQITEERLAGSYPNGIGITIYDLIQLEDKVKKTYQDKLFTRALEDANLTYENYQKLKQDFQKYISKTVEKQKKFLEDKIKELQNKKVMKWW